jgi:hypothetical protein
MFMGTAAVGVLIFSALILGGVVLIYGLAWHFASRAFGEERMPTWLGMPGNYYRDAFWLGMGGAALWIGLNRLLGVVSQWWPTAHESFPARFGDSFDAMFPAAMVIGGALVRALFVTGIFVLASSVLGSKVRVRWVRMLLFLGVAAALVSNWGTPADFFKQFLLHAILLAIIVNGIRLVSRFNLLGLLLAIASVDLARGAVELLAQPDSFYHAQGYLVVATLALLLGLPLVAWRMGADEKLSAA